MPKTRQHNTLRICLLCFTIILFRSFLKKDIRTLIFINQKKPCISLELDSKVKYRPKKILKKRKKDNSQIIFRTLYSLSLSVQTLITSNDLVHFLVLSPKLYLLLQAIDDAYEIVYTAISTRGIKFQTMQICINWKQILFYWLC
jgi:hypothetical protein